MSTSILVIDANREFGILIRQSLEEGGDYQVTLAADANEALERARVEQFQLALIDLNLSDSSPAELIEQLRSIHADLPIVVIPRAQSEGTHLASLGVQGVLTKPFYLPNLAGMLQQILAGRTGRAWGPRSNEPPDLRPEPTPADERVPAEAPVRQDPSAPLTDDELLERLEMTETAAAILIGHSGLLAAAGLGPTGASEAASILHDRGPDQEAGAAVAHYVRLSGAVQDYLLYGIRLDSGYVLGAFFPSEAPFGVVRRNTQELAQLLADLPPAEEPVDEPLDLRHAAPGLSQAPDLPDLELEVPAAVPDQAPLETSPSEAQAPEAAPVELEAAAPRSDRPPVEPLAPDEPPTEAGSPLEAEGGQPAAGRQEPIDPSKLPSMAGARLPSDWIPAGSMNLGPWASIADMISTPAADEILSSEPTAPTMPTVDLPRDWVPTQQPPEAYLPPDLLAANKELCQQQSAEGSQPAAGEEEPIPGFLSYTMVLIPRFPEHHLSGAFASLLRQWTERYGLAWDWRIKDLKVEDSYLLLRVSLDAEVAPAEALSRLQAHLSERILAHFPTLGRELPSGRFWAPQEWLFSGPPPGPDRLKSILVQTRRAQGVTS